MIESKATPGPWIFDGSDSVTGDGDRIGVAILKPMPRFWANEVCRIAQDDEAVANGRLIAAAPDLLAALEEMLRLTDGITGMMGGPERAAARKAVALAKGEPWPPVTATKGA